MTELVYRSDITVILMDYKHFYGLVLFMLSFNNSSNIQSEIKKSLAEYNVTNIF